MMPKEPGINIKHQTPANMCCNNDGEIMLNTCCKNIWSIYCWEGYVVHWKIDESVDEDEIV
jgi:hypothetical protein